MAVVVDFCRSPSVGEPALRKADEAAYMSQWELPDETRKGDIGILFAAGRRRCYLGWETIESNWRVGRSGLWEGEDHVLANWHLFREPIPAAEVEEAIGFRAPSGPCVVDEAVGRRLFAYLRTPRAPEARAIEGILTESRRRSRTRSPKLRNAKLAQAGGQCEGCRTDFSKLPGGLDGRRVLTVHHREQLSAFDEPRTVTVDDLAVLCANCHMLVHSDPKKTMPVDELARRLRTRRGSNVG
jgi:5-methylcytosine-specific restriction endonuclease McrA